MRVLAQGIGASPGTASGAVKVVLSLGEAIKKMCDGDVMVTVMTDPDYTPFVIKASAIVTNTGGMLCHAAIVSRELRKPCVVGTKNATTVLKDGMMVTVDGLKGIIYSQ